MAHRTTHGYIRVGNEYEHRLVAAELIGRPLRKDEVVHHRNGDGTDNHPENLEVLDSQAEHVRLHLMNHAISDDELKALLVAGKTQKELLALGATSRRLFRLRRELGIPKGSPSLSIAAGTFTRRRPRAVHKFDYAEARRLREQGLTLQQIADRLGVTHPAIRYALRVTEEVIGSSV